MNLQAELDDALGRMQQGRLDEAIGIYTQILGRDRAQPDALYMLGAISFRLGQMEQALEFATASTSAAPSEARGWTLKALALRNLHRAEEALAATRHAIALDANQPEAWECAGTALMQYGKWAEARTHLEQALEHFPQHANLRGSYALVLSEQGDAAALNESDAALALDASCTSAWLAKITVLSNGGDFDRALMAAREAMESAAVKKPFAFARGMLALLTGQFDEGYELLASDRPAHGPAASLPDWRGEANKHVMLFGEQGYGDTLQFIRFVNRVRQQAGRVTARVPQQLERLLRASMPDLDLSVYKPLTTSERRPMHEVDPVFDFPQDNNERADARCGFLALPHALKIGAETGGEQVPYLRADPKLVAAWREKLAALPQPRIAISWAGSPQHGNDHNRSSPFEAINPLIEKFRAHLISMQIGPGQGLAAQAEIFDAAPFIKDFADSAALLANVDLLITVDSAPAHLAGGMGIPVWLLLPFNPDWRWLTKREDSPWYPSMRLFRQPQPKDWTSVIGRVSGEIEKLIAG